MISREDFNGIYLQHVDAVFRLCLRAVTRRDIAEEITSEVFLSLYQSADSVAHDQIPAWLFAVAKRRSADYWHRWYLEEQESAVDPQPQAETHIPEFSLTDLLSRCTNLKPVHRICVILSLAQGMSRSEIAAQTGLSELQVKRHLQYSLKLLRHTLSAHRSPLPPAQEISADA